MWKAVKLGNKAGKTTEEATGEGAPMGENAVSPLPDAEAPLAMMEIEKTPISTPLHDMPPPPDEKWVLKKMRKLFPICYPYLYKILRSNIVFSPQS